MGKLGKTTVMFFHNGDLSCNWIKIKDLYFTLKFSALQFNSQKKVYRFSQVNAIVKSVIKELSLLYDKYTTKLQVNI